MSNTENMGQIQSRHQYYMTIKLNSFKLKIIKLYDCSWNFYYLSIYYSPLCKALCIICIKLYNIHSPASQLDTLAKLFSNTNM